ncbi:MAG: aminopeptidase [Candidatus Thermoplasmatota archaeon]|nr:aminopeptidase [Candidatus Thermoplasmatota archaeon]
MDKIEKAGMTLSNCLSPKRSDRLLVICDKNTLEIGQVFFEAADSLKFDPLLMEMPVGRHHGDEPPTLVADIMIHSDVIVAPTTYSITYTNATRAALARGARIATMPGLTMQMLEQGGLLADYEKIARNIRRFGSRFNSSKEVKVLSDDGTDITFSIERRRWVLDDNGLCHKRGSITNLPAGKVFIAPVERSANGKIVIDGAFMENMSERIELRVENGLITDITGNNMEVRSLMERGKCARTICEFGIGMNPRSNIIGNILEDQKALGTVHFGFGDNSTFGGEVRCDIHVDGMVLKPDVLIDGTQIIKGGNMVLKL